MAFWRSRHGALSVAYEQLDTASARAVVALLKARSSDRNLLASFHSQHSELVRVRAHACFCFIRVVPSHSIVGRGEDSGQEVFEVIGRIKGSQMLVTERQNRQ
jgi:hypothetical protein